MNKAISKGVKLIVNWIRVRLLQCNTYHNIHYPFVRRGANGHRERGKIRHSILTSFGYF